MHDFIDKEKGKVTPYGVYDVAANSGWVAVGTDHDTAQFAVHTIRAWWGKVGREAYPGASRLLVTADGGGSNGYRTRLWKTELARFATETGLEVTVCHLPPGTSKWNKIEHRLFSQISLAWRDRPLVSHEVIVNTIAAVSRVAPVHCCTGAPSGPGMHVPAHHGPGKPLRAVQVVCCSTVFPAVRGWFLLRWQVSCTRCVRWLRAALGVSWWTR